MQVYSTLGCTKLLNLNPGWLSINIHVFRRGDILLWRKVYYIYLVAPFPGGGYYYKASFRGGGVGASMGKNCVTTPGIFCLLVSYRDKPNEKDRCTTPITMKCEARVHVYDVSQLSSGSWKQVRNHLIFKQKIGWCRIWYSSSLIRDSERYF